MVNENLKQKLAEKNGNLEEYRNENIRKKIKEKYLHLEDEVAILRKIVVVLARKVQEQHPNINLDEIEEYNWFVENCKLQAKEELENI